MIKLINIDEIYVFSVFSDSSFAEDKQDRRSQTGFAVLASGSLVNWMSKTDSKGRAAMYGQLAQQIAKGELYAPIDKHFALEDIAEAAKYSWAGERRGKVMLAPNGV